MYTQIHELLLIFFPSQNSVLPPIPTKSLTAADVDDLTRTTRDAMLNALISVTESPMGQKATQPFVSSKDENQALKATAVAALKN